MNVELNIYIEAFDLKIKLETFISSTFINVCGGY